MIEINKNYNESNLETMAKMPDCFVDLTITSPPYDGLRTYNGYSFPFEEIARELFRITKDGGVLVWIVGDATVKGSESGTSFRQALYFKEIGFNLHDTMIYEKPQACFGSNLCYLQSFEYMFILSKGKPKTINFIRDRKNVVVGKQSVTKNAAWKKDGTKSERHIIESDEYGKRKNIWTIPVGHSRKNHPAVFPEQLANDHIISWSNENDLVYDCFMGSGTTAKMSILNNRNWIGSEISSEYCEIINEEVNKAQEEKRKEKDLTQKTLFGNEM